MTGIDGTVDPAQLRWVGTQFVYFLDIPMVDDGNERFSTLSLDNTYSSSNLGISPWEFTRTLIEGVMDLAAPLDPGRLVSRDGTIISGDTLARLLVPWARGLLRDAKDLASDSAHQQRGQQAKNVLAGTISDLHNTLRKANSAYSDLEGSDADILRALGTLVVSLSRCAEAVWGGDEAFRPLDCTWILGEMIQLMRDKLGERWGRRSAGEMDRLLDGGGIPFIAYAISRQPTLNNVATVVTTKYVRPHVTPGCTCALVKASLDAVSALLEQDIVPVVVFDGADLVVRSASTGPYVAISHVWADGLGSKTEEGLPRCQVIRLNALVQKLIPDGAFWQDGLCVPRERSLRRRAIGLMAGTYANADKVLVIDGGIRVQASLSGPKEECLLRIATSGWMQRLWTLQEGMLARELYFEVSDGLIDCSHFDGATASVACGLVPILHYRRQNDTDFQQRLTHVPHCTLHDLIRLLRFRSTKYPTDEPLAIAGLLGVDAAKLVRIENGEERMKTLYLEVREVPHNLVVLGWSVKRLSSIPNFEWAPASLSAVLWPGDSEDVATCTVDGLFGTFTVVRFLDMTLSTVRGKVSTSLDMAVSSTYSGEYQPEGPPARGDDFVFFDLELSTCRNGHIFNAFLMKDSATPESRREQAVGVVHIPSDCSAFGGQESTMIDCRYIAPGKVTWAEPPGAADVAVDLALVNAAIYKERQVRVT